MNRVLLLSVLFFASAFTANAQRPAVVKKDSTVRIQQDTVAKPLVLEAGKQVKVAVDTGKTKYINKGKIAGRRAILSSLMLPGLGQIRNGVTVYRLAKVAGIYTGATMLTLSYIDNSKNYKVFLDEVQHRKENNDEPKNQQYASYPTDGLIIAKDTFRRNKEVIIFSYVGLYILSAVEAYIDARLKYFDVEDIGFKVSPGIINSDRMYGYNQVTPGVKLTFRL